MAWGTRKVGSGLEGPQEVGCVGLRDELQRLERARCRQSDPKTFGRERNSGYSGRSDIPVSKKIEYPQLAHAA
jgi:hypothetical protein